jgi:hypothetical protein
MFSSCMSFICRWNRVCGWWIRKLPWSSFWSRVCTTQVDSREANTRWCGCRRFVQVVESSTGSNLKRVVTSITLNCMKCQRTHPLHLTRASQLASCERGSRYCPSCYTVQLTKNLSWTGLLTAMWVRELSNLLQKLYLPDARWGDCLPVRLFSPPRNVVVLKVIIRINLVNLNLI